MWLYETDTVTSGSGVAFQMGFRSNCICCGFLTAYFKTSGSSVSETSGLIAAQEECSAGKAQCVTHKMLNHVFGESSLRFGPKTFQLSAAKETGLIWAPPAADWRTLEPAQTQSLRVKDQNHNWIEMQVHQHFNLISIGFTSDAFTHVTVKRTHRSQPRSLPGPPPHSTPDRCLLMPHCCSFSSTPDCRIMSHFTQIKLQLV